MTDNPNARLLDCGWCYEEQGEEVHPHPECPIGPPMAPARYRDRRDGQIIEAVQWTGSNEPALTAFAPDRFATAAVEDRIDPEDDAHVLIEESHWVAIRPGCWVLRYVDHFDVESDVDFRAGWESVPAGLVAVPPTTADRDRIADVLRPHASLGGTPPRYELPFFDGATPSLPRISGWKPLDEVADAVLGVLPAGSEDTATTRAAALEEAAEHLLARCPHLGGVDALPKCPCFAVEELRRLAAETQPDTEAAPLPVEDPARIDRLRPEFTDHASVEAIDVQLRRARTQERRWHLRVEWLISLRSARVEQKARGEWPADGRCPACGHSVCDGEGPCGARSGSDFCTCPGPAASAGVQTDEEA